MKYIHLEEELGAEEAKLLRGKTVTVVGLGGIGSTVADLLVRTGINLRIIEKGRVEEEDLDRLSLFTQDDVSKFKATQAKKYLTKINPEPTIKSFNEEILKETLFLMDSDLVVDCSGNSELSDLISEYCFKKGIPCVLGVVRDHKCIVAASTDKKAVHAMLKGVNHERTEGLLPAATHMVAGFMYVKTLKLLLGVKPKRGVLIYDVWEQQFEDKRGKKK